jgi:hypothetical protein
MKIEQPKEKPIVPIIAEKTEKYFIKIKRNNSYHKRKPKNIRK